MHLFFPIAAAPASSQLTCANIDVSDFDSLLLSQLCAGDGVVIVLLVGVLLIAAGLLAEGVAKASIRSEKILDGLVMTESLGKIVGVATTLGALLWMSRQLIGVSATAAVWIVALVIVVVAAIVSTLAVVILRKRPATPLSSSPPDGHHLSWTLSTPPPLNAKAPTLLQLIREADDVADKCRHANFLAQNLSGAPQILAATTAAARESKALKNRLQIYKSGTKALTEL